MLLLASEASECKERDWENIEVWVSERGTASKNRVWCRRLDQQILWTTEENAAVEMEPAAAIYIVTRKSVIAVHGMTQCHIHLYIFLSAPADIFALCTRLQKNTHLQVSNFCIEECAWNHIIDWKLFWKSTPKYLRIFLSSSYPRSVIFLFQRFIHSCFFDFLLFFTFTQINLRRCHIYI